MSILQQHQRLEKRVTVTHEKFPVSMVEREINGEDTIVIAFRKADLMNVAHFGEAKEVTNRKGEKVMSRPALFATSEPCKITALVTDGEEQALVDLAIGSINVFLRNVKAVNEAESTSHTAA
jgi:hypothetical protein